MNDKIKKWIRIKAKSEGKDFKQAWAEHQLEKKKIQEEKAKALAEEKLKKEQEERKNHPTQEDLLSEIRDLLREQNNKNQK